MRRNRFPDRSGVKPRRVKLLEGVYEIRLDGTGYLWQTTYMGKTRILSRYPEDVSGKEAVRMLLMNTGAKPEYRPYEIVLHRGREREIISYPYREEGKPYWFVGIRKKGDPTTFQTVEVAELNAIGEEVTSE